MVGDQLCGGGPVMIDSPVYRLRKLKFCSWPTPSEVTGNSGRGGLWHLYLIVLHRGALQLIRLSG